MKTCAICGKEIDILYPDLWRYKRGDPVHVKAWLCSWKCLRIWDDPEKKKGSGRNGKDEEGRDAGGEAGAEAEGRKAEGDPAI